MAISNSDPDCRSGTSSFALRSQVPFSRRFASPIFRRGNFHATRMVERVNRSLLCEESWPTELMRKKSVVLMIVLTLVLLHRF